MAKLASDENEWAKYLQVGKSTAAREHVLKVAHTRAQNVIGQG